MLRAFAYTLAPWQRAVLASSGFSGAARAASGATLQRSTRFAELTQDDLAFFRSVLGDRGVVTDPDALEPYNKYVVFAAMRKEVAVGWVPLSAEIAVRQRPSHQHP